MKKNNEIWEDLLLNFFLRVDAPKESLKALDYLSVITPLIENQKKVTDIKNYLWNKSVATPPPTSNSNKSPNRQKSSDLRNPETGVTLLSSQELCSFLNFPCSICGDILENHEKLALHVLSKHGKEKGPESIKQELDASNIEINKLKNTNNNLDIKIKKMDQELQTT